MTVKGKKVCTKKGCKTYSSHKKALKVHGAIMANKKKVRKK